MLVPAQCRAARTLLGLPQLALAREARVALRTLINFERGRRNPQAATLQAITAALERLGIELIAENGGGVGARVRCRGQSIDQSRASALDRPRVCGSYADDRGRCEWQVVPIGSGTGS